MGGKKKYMNIFGSFTEPFNCDMIIKNAFYPKQFIRHMQISRMFISAKIVYMHIWPSASIFNVMTARIGATIAKWKTCKTRPGSVPSRKDSQFVFVISIANTQVPLPVISEQISAILDMHFIIAKTAMHRTCIDCPTCGQSFPQMKFCHGSWENLPYSLETLNRSLHATQSTHNYPFSVLTLLEPQDDTDRVRCCMMLEIRSN